MSSNDKLKRFKSNQKKQILFSVAVLNSSSKNKVQTKNRHRLPAIIFHIITIFPEVFDSYLKTSILGRAQKDKLIEINFVNLRHFATDKRKTVDDRPYGGGAGMVLMAEPILRAYSAIQKSRKSKKKLKTKIIVFSAKGKEFNQKMAYEWVRKYNEFIFIAGRYEGIDERVRLALKAEEISIGRYVLTDGDIAAMVVISAMTRLIPGVIKSESLKEESHWNLLNNQKEKEMSGRGLEYPHYTRPEVLVFKGKKYRTPKVLLSGDHQQIKVWRLKHSR